MGNSENRQQDPNEITMQKIHKCSDNCAKMFAKTPESGIGFGSYHLVDNPAYIDGKCNDSEKIEDTCVYISSFDENDHQLLNPDEIVIHDAKYKIVISYPLSKSVEFIFESPNGFTRLDCIKNIVNSYKYIYKMEDETATEKTFYFEKKCNNCQNSIIEPTEYHIVNDESTCAVCLENMEVGSVCHKLTCDHLFHKDCIAEWFDRNPTCPLCKKSHRDTSNCGKCSDGIVSNNYIGKVLPVELRGSFLNRDESDGIYGIWGHDIGDLVIEGMTYDAEKKEFSMSIGS